MTIRRLASLLVALALMLAPIGMLGGRAAMAHAPVAQAAMEHCGDMSDMDRSGESQERPMLDCMAACAAIPSPEQRLPEKAVDRPMFEVPTLRDLSGVSAEAATPPPRFS